MGPDEHPGSVSVARHNVMVNRQQRSVLFSASNEAKQSMAYCK